MLRAGSSKYSTCRLDSSRSLSAAIFAMPTSTSYFRLLFAPCKGGGGAGHWSFLLFPVKVNPCRQTVGSALLGCLGWACGPRRFMKTQSCHAGAPAFEEV